jgi:cell division protein FtsL
VSALIVATTERPWRLDLSSLGAILAASAGVLAAIGTGLLAYFTWRLATETRDLARETEEDVRAEWRPIILEDTLTTVTAEAGENLATVILVLRTSAADQPSTVASWSRRHRAARRVGALAGKSLRNLVRFEMRGWPQHARLRP